MSNCKSAKKARHDKGEGYARACIAHELGATVTKHDDGSRQGMHDLEVLYPEDTRGAVEVTTCADGKAQALWNATARIENWIEPSLKLSWIVRFERDCKLRPKWKPRLVKLLRALEAAQINSLEITRDWRDEFDEEYRFSRDLTPFLDELRAIGACQLIGDPTGTPGQIFLWPVLITTGWVPDNADPVLDWLEPWIIEPKRKDNLDKLARSGHPHRHLFIGFPGFDDCPEMVTMAMSDSETAIPTRPPSLPHEITEIWLVGSWSDGPGLRWSAATGWKYFDKLTLARVGGTNQ